MSTRNSLPLTTKLLWALLFFLGISLLVASVNMENRQEKAQTDQPVPATESQ